MAARLSQGDLGREIGLDRTMIAKIETGSRRIDAIELTRIAATLRLPLDHFLDVAPQVVSRRAELLEEEATEAGREGFTLEAALLTWLRDVRQMIDLGSLKPPPILRYPRAVDSESKARDAAHWLREQAGLQHEPIATLMTICERAGLYPSISDSPGDGASLVDGHIAVAVVSRTGDPGRRRATAAHELGHVVLGDEYSTDLGVHASRREREALVDVFAAELLLPLGVFEPISDSLTRDKLIQLAATYRTSWSLTIRQASQAATSGANDIRRLLSTTPTKGELADAVGWIPQPDLDSIRVPPSFAHAVLDARKRNLITVARAVELLRGQIVEEDLPPQGEDEIAP